MQNPKYKLQVPRDQIKDIDGLERIARALQQAAAELKQANDVHELIWGSGHSPDTEAQWDAWWNEKWENDTGYLDSTEEDK